MRDDFNRLRLVRTESVGPITYRRLLDRFPDPADALAALPGQGVSPPLKTEQEAGFNH